MLWVSGWIHVPLSVVLVVRRNASLVLSPFPDWHPLLPEGLHSGVTSSLHQTFCLQLSFSLPYNHCFSLQTGATCITFLEARVRTAPATHIQQSYNQDVTVVTERPPHVEMGDIATPVCFRVSQTAEARPAPNCAGNRHAIAINRRSSARGSRWRWIREYLPRTCRISDGATVTVRKPLRQSRHLRLPKCIVEHTNINPNKAAHIGQFPAQCSFGRHARAHTSPIGPSRGSTKLHRQYRSAGRRCCHWYFSTSRKKSPEEVRALAAQPKFDYFCWDLYARVTQFFEEDKTRLALRGETLKSIEEDRGSAAEMAGIVGSCCGALPPGNHGASGH